MLGESVTPPQSHDHSKTEIIVTAIIGSIVSYAILSAIPDRWWAKQRGEK